MRFNLERENINNSLVKDSWVAKTGLDLILFRFIISNEKTILIGYYHDKQVDRIKFIDFLENEYKKAKDNYEQFIKDGINTKDLIKTSIFLAKLDVKVRAGIIDADLDNIENHKIDELKKLIDIVPWDKFKAEKHCILNPSFGKGSKIVGGADADLIIDGKLIEIKSTKNLKLEREYLNQIIGYYLLSIIGGVNGNKTIEINNIGIYFARYGYYWQMPISDFYSKDVFEKLSIEFIKLVKDKSLDLVGSRSNKMSQNLKFNTRSLKNRNRFKDIEW